MGEYLTIKETAEKWDVSIRWVQTLCATGKIEGAIKFGRDWAVPKDAERPDDSRVKSGKYKGWRDKKNSSERMG